MPSALVDIAARVVHTAHERWLAEEHTSLGSINGFENDFLFWKGTVYDAFKLRTPPSLRPSQDVGIRFSRNTIPALVVMSCLEQDYSQTQKEMTMWMTKGQGKVQVVIILCFSTMDSGGSGWKHPVSTSLRCMVRAYEYTGNDARSPYQLVLCEALLSSYCEDMDDVDFPPLAVTRHQLTGSLHAPPNLNPSHRLSLMSLWNLAHDSFEQSAEDYEINEQDDFLEPEPLFQNPARSDHSAVDGEQSYRKQLSKDNSTDIKDQKCEEDGISSANEADNCDSQSEGYRNADDDNISDSHINDGYFYDDDGDDDYGLNPADDRDGIDSVNEYETYDSDYASDMDDDGNTTDASAGNDDAAISEDHRKSNDLSSANLSRMDNKDDEIDSISENGIDSSIEYNPGAYESDGDLGDGNTTDANMDEDDLGVVDGDLSLDSDDGICSTNENEAYGSDDDDNNMDYDNLTDVAMDDDDDNDTVVADDRGIQSQGEPQAPAIAVADTPPFDFGSGLDNYGIDSGNEHDPGAYDSDDCPADLDNGNTTNTNMDEDEDDRRAEDGDFSLTSDDGIFSTNENKAYESDNYNNIDNGDPTDTIIGSDNPLAANADSNAGQVDRRLTPHSEHKWPQALGIYSDHSSYGHHDGSRSLDSPTSLAWHREQSVIAGMHRSLSKSDGNEARSPQDYGRTTSNLNLSSTSPSTVKIVKSFTDIGFQNTLTAEGHYEQETSFPFPHLHNHHPSPPLLGQTRIPASQTLASRQMAMHDSVCQYCAALRTIAKYDLGHGFKVHLTLAAEVNLGDQRVQRRRQKFIKRLEEALQGLVDDEGDEENESENSNEYISPGDYFAVSGSTLVCRKQVGICYCTNCIPLHHESSFMDIWKDERSTGGKSTKKTGTSTGQAPGRPYPPDMPRQDENELLSPERLPTSFDRQDGPPQKWVRHMNTPHKPSDETTENTQNSTKTQRHDEKQRNKHIKDGDTGDTGGTRDEYTQLSTKTERSSEKQKGEYTEGGGTGDTGDTDTGGTGDEYTQASIKTERRSEKQEGRGTGDTGGTCDKYTHAPTKTERRSEKQNYERTEGGSTGDTGGTGDEYTPASIKTERRSEKQEGGGIGDTGGTDGEYTQLSTKTEKRSEKQNYERTEGGGTGDTGGTVDEYTQASTKTKRRSEKQEGGGIGDTEGTDDEYTQASTKTERRSEKQNYERTEGGGTDDTRSTNGEYIQESTNTERHSDKRRSGGIGDVGGTDEEYTQAPTNAERCSERQRGGHSDSEAEAKHSWKRHDEHTSGDSTGNAGITTDDSTTKEKHIHTSTKSHGGIVEERKRRRTTDSDHTSSTGDTEGEHTKQYTDSKSEERKGARTSGDHTSSADNTETEAVAEHTHKSTESYSGKRIGAGPPGGAQLQPLSLLSDTKDWTNDHRRQSRGDRRRKQHMPKPPLMVPDTSLTNRIIPESTNDFTIEQDTKTYHEHDDQDQADTPENITAQIQLLLAKLNSVSTSNTSSTSNRATGRVLPKFHVQMECEEVIESQDLEMEFTLSLKLKGNRTQLHGAGGMCARARKFLHLPGGCSQGLKLPLFARM